MRGNLGRRRFRAVLKKKRSTRCKSLVVVTLRYGSGVIKNWIFEAATPHGDKRYGYERDAKRRRVTSYEAADQVPAIWVQLTKRKYAANHRNPPLPRTDRAAKNSKDSVAPMTDVDVRQGTDCDILTSCLACCCYNFWLSLAVTSVDSITARSNVYCSACPAASDSSSQGPLFDSRPARDL